MNVFQPGYLCDVRNEKLELNLLFCELACSWNVEICLHQIHPTDWMLLLLFLGYLEATRRVEISFIYFLFVDVFT